MKRHLPFALTTLRLVLGPVALGCALAGVSRLVFLPLLVTATLSDIFDGILARLWRLCAPVVTLRLQSARPVRRIAELESLAEGQI